MYQLPPGVCIAMLLCARTPRGGTRGDGTTATYLRELLAARDHRIRCHNSAETRARILFLPANFRFFPL